MAASEHLNGEQFGMPKREESEMQGNAIAGHLWEGMEHIMAPEGMALQQRQRAVTKLTGQFPGQKLHQDEEGEPYHAVQHGKWEGRYFGGPYVELHHQHYGPQEVINVTNDKTGEPENFGHEQFRGMVRDFAEHQGPEYEQAARRNG